MKLTKTETVKVFKFVIDEDDFELVAAKYKEQAIEYMFEVYGDQIEYTNIKCIGENTLKKSMGRSVLGNRNSKLISAYDSLVKAYRKRNLPFVFWVTNW
jgi:hypothetical protein